MVGGQEINGWYPGNQWLESRKSMGGAQETNVRSPAGGQGEPLT